MALSVGTSSQKTNKKPLNLLNKDKKIDKKITISEKDKKWINFVRGRLNDMEIRKSTVEKNLDTWQRQFEAPFSPYYDGRSSSNVPLERAIIDLAVAELKKRATQYNFKGVKGAETSTKIQENLWKYDWSTYQRAKTILIDDYDAAKFGTSIIYTGYEINTRVIKDFKQDMDLTDPYNEKNFETFVETEGKLKLDNFDIRHFYVDDRAYTIDEAEDCIAFTYHSWEEIQNMKSNKMYKDLDRLVPKQNQDHKFRNYTTRDEQGMGNAKYVEFTHYWNKASDTYIVIGNGHCIIRQHPIMNATHSLPFSMRQFFRNTNSIWGTGLCEILMTFKSEINTLREMLMDAIKRSNQEVIAIGGGLTFDGDSFAYDNTVREFTGNSLAGNFQQITGTPPNQAIFGYMDRLFKDVAMFSGIDVQNIIGLEAQTAFQTAVQRESSLQRMNTVIANRDESYQRMANLHLDNIRTFYPRNLVNKLKLRPKDDKKKWLGTWQFQFEVEGEAMKGKKFVSKKGKNVVKVSLEDIRDDVSVEVFTNINTPAIDEVEKVQMAEFFGQVIPSIAQAYQINPDLENLKPQKEAVKDMAAKYNIELDAEAGENKEAMDEIQKIKQTLQGNINKTQTAQLQQQQDEEILETPADAFAPQIPQ